MTKQGKEGNGMNAKNINRIAIDISERFLQVSNVHSFTMEMNEVRRMTVLAVENIKIHSRTPQPKARRNGVYLVYHRS